MSTGPSPFGTDEWLAKAREELKAKPCYRCGEVGAMTLDKVFAAKDPLDFSLAGAQMKVSGSFVLIMSHEKCGLSGRITQDN